MRWQWAVIVLSLVTTGCGVCGQIAQHREAFERKVSATNHAPATHLRFTIPKSEIDGWEQRALANLQATAMSVPGLGDLGQSLGNLQVSPRAVTLVAEEKGVRVGIDLDIKRGQQTLFGLEMKAVAPTRYDAKKGRLTVEVRADLFKSIKPRIRGDAVRGLTAAIRKALPMGMGRLVPAKRIDRLAKKGVERLLASTYKQLRSSLLTQLGRLTTFELEIPRLPLASLSLTTHNGAWIIDIQSTFSARGLAPPAKSQPNSIQLDVSAFALAHIGNWAMEEGHLPTRYTEDGRASQSGPFLVGFDWTATKRPAKVHVWTADPDDAGVCVRVLAGGLPRLSYRKNALQVGFSDVKIEDAAGPPLFQSALKLLGITERAFNYTKVIALDSRLQLGNIQTLFALEDAKIRGDIVTFELMPKRRNVR